MSSEDTKDSYLLKEEANAPLINEEVKDPLHEEEETELVTLKNLDEQIEEILIVPKKSPYSLDSFDVLRGVILIFMALDHAHIAIGIEPGLEYWNGQTPGYTMYPTLESAVGNFFFRMVTYMCDPGLFFLTGFEMTYLIDHLHIAEQWSFFQIFRYFLLRGVVLTLIGFIITNAGFTGKFMCSLCFPQQTIWLIPSILFSLGWIIILGSIFLLFDLWLHGKYPNLKFRWGTIPLCLLILFSGLSTQLITPSPLQQYEKFNPLDFLFWFSGDVGTLELNYPIFPWMAVFGFGSIWRRIFMIQKDPPRTIKLLTANGIIFLILFFGFRVWNFGNFQLPYFQNLPYSGIQFFLTSKYPPSSAFLLFGLGLFITVHGIIYYGKLGTLKWIPKLAITFGRTTLFFYIVNFVLTFFPVLLFCAVFKYDRTQYIVLLYVLIGWIGILALMYPLCNWYAKFKEKKSFASLWRFF